MSVLETIFLVILLVIFFGCFIYCLFKENRSADNFRKRLIKHIDTTETLYNAWVADLTSRVDRSDHS